MRAGGKRRCCPAILCPKHSMLLLHYALHIKYSPSTVLIVYHNHTVMSRNIIKNPIRHDIVLYTGNHTHKQYMVLCHKNPLLVRQYTFP